jgi:hypothetical protein
MLQIVASLYAYHDDSNLFLIQATAPKGCYDTHKIMTFSITTLSLATLSIMTLSIASKFSKFNVILMILFVLT